MDNLTFRGGAIAVGNSLLTATGAETVHDATVAISLANDGQYFNKAAVVDGVTPVLDAVTGLAFPVLVGGASVANTPGNGAVVVWAYDTAGVVKCSQGPIEKLDMLGSFITAPQFPSVAANTVPFAYQVLKSGATASATAIVFGTSNWNATGYTNVIRNVAFLPSRPQVA